MNETIVYISRSEIHGGQLDELKVASATSPRSPNDWSRSSSRMGFTSMRRLIA